MLAAAIPIHSERTPIVLRLKPRDDVQRRDEHEEDEDRSGDSAVDPAGEIGGGNAP